MISKCRVTIDGKKVMNDIPCDFTMDDLGNFILGRTRPNFVIVVGNQSAKTGYWNGETTKSSGYGELGVLSRDPQNAACWVNDRATICAWK